MLTVERRNYKGGIDEVKSERSFRKLPLDESMVQCIGKLHSQFPNSERMFQSETRTPVNPGNALKRYIRPAARTLGIELGGYHDFRHILSTNLRRSGVHPKVVSDILGQKKVNLAMDVYDRTELQDFVQPLSLVAKELVSSGIKSGAAT